MEGQSTMIDDWYSIFMIYAKDQQIQFCDFYSERNIDTDLSFSYNEV